MLKRALLIIVVTSSFVLAGCSRDTRQHRKASSGEIQEQSKRLVIDLNGTWEIAEGGMDSVPAIFEHRIPVPGLVDMAEPAFHTWRGRPGLASRRHSSGEAVPALRPAGIPSAALRTGLPVERNKGKMPLPRRRSGIGEPLPWINPCRTWQY